MGQNQSVDRAAFLLQVPGENLFLAFSGFSRLPSFLGSWPLTTPASAFVTIFSDSDPPASSHKDLCA